jgi:hypothetical protein
MTEPFVLTAVTRPTSLQLKDAIFSYSENAPESTVDESIKDGLAIIGEACSLLDEGKTTDEALSSLVAQGLSTECAITFVEKANEIVQSNNRMNALHSHPKTGIASKLMKISIIIAMMLIFLIYTYSQ